MQDLPCDRLRLVEIAGTFQLPSHLNLNGVDMINRLSEGHEGHAGKKAERYFKFLTSGK